MKKFAVADVVDFLREASFSLLPTFVRIAQIIIGILLAIELIREAIGLAHGEGFRLSKKLIIWVLAMIMISAFYYNGDKETGLANGIYNTAKSFGSYAFVQFDEAVNSFVDNCSKDQPSLGIGSVFKPKRMIFAIGYAIAIAVGAICFLLIYVLICGCYGCLALLLIMGPVAFAFMLNEDFRQIAIRWINSIITNLFMIIIYGVTMVMVSSVLSATLKSAKEALDSYNLPLTVLVLCIGPMLAIGLTHQGPKAVMALLSGVGGSGGGGEMAAGFVGATMWSASKAYGQSVWNATKKAWQGGGGGGEGGGGGGSPGGAAGSGGAGCGGDSGTGGEPAPSLQAAPGAAPGPMPTEPTLGNRLMPNFVRWADKGGEKVQRLMRRIDDREPKSEEEPVAQPFAEGAFPECDDPGPAAD